MTIIEIFSKSGLKTKFEIMLQLTSFNLGSWLKNDCSRRQKNVPKNKAKLFEDKQNFLFFA